MYIIEGSGVQKIYNKEGININANFPLQSLIVFFYATNNLHGRSLVTLSAEICTKYMINWYSGWKFIDLKNR